MGDDNEKQCMSILDIMLEDMASAPSFYQPTEFWQVGVKRIIADIKANGLSGFRCYPSCNSFFVPRYARPYYLRHRNLIDPLAEWLNTLPFRKAGCDILDLLNGRVNALADYRVFRAADGCNETQPVLSDLSESEVGQPSEQFVFENRRYSLPFLSYLRALVFLKSRLHPARLERVLEIGGGFGSLGEIILKSKRSAVYVDVDLPPVAAVATYYLREVFGKDAVWGYEQSRSLKRIDLDDLPDGCRAVVLCPWQLPLLRGTIDLFANFISFQEMEPDVVRNYIQLAQRHLPSYVMLRNLREGKRKKESPEEFGVCEPVLLDEMVAWFDQYNEKARDTMTFGEKKIDGFHSELVLLSRRGN